MIQDVLTRIINGSANNKAVAVVNPDGSNISGGGGGGGDGIAAFADSGGTDRKGLVDGDRHVQVDILTMPEVSATVDTTGLATQATLVLIKAKTDNIPSLGQALAAASVPVVLTAAQMTTLTPPTPQTDALTDSQLRASAVPVSGTFFQATQPISHAALTELAAAINSDKLDINISSGNISGFATSAKQDTIIGHLDTLDSIDFATQTTLAAVKAKTDNIPALGQALAAASVPVVLTAAQITTLTPPAAITGFATSAKQDTIIGHIDGLEGLLTTIDADTGTIAGAIAGTEMQVDVLTMPTVAVTGTFWQATQPVSLASVPSHPVTNAGTFAVQNTAATPAGTNNIGDVDVLTLPALPAGTNNIGDVDVLTLPALATGTNAIGRVGHDVTGVGTGRTTVTTAGSRVVLAASTACKKVDIQAELDNTGVIVVGGTGVVAALATRQGIALNPGDSYSLEIDNLNDINIDSTVSTDGVTYTYYT